MLRWCIDCCVYWMDYISGPDDDEYEPHDCKGENKTEREEHEMPEILSEYWQQIASGLIAEAATLQMTDEHAVAKWVGRATSTLAEALRISEAAGNGTV